MGIWVTLWAPWVTHVEGQVQDHDAPELCGAITEKERHAGFLCSMKTKKNLE